MTLSMRGFPAPWRELYLAALFESNASVSDRIELTEKALLERERTLLSDPNSGEERRAIRNALDALRALRLAHRLRKKTAPRAA